jgi:hypothetical protein
VQRNFNYTHRKKITRDRVRVQVSKQGNQVPSFDLELKLDELQLPPDARVFVEAQNKTQYMRFDFGTVAAPTPPADRALSEFGGNDDMEFRVKVVQMEGTRGKLLAEASGVYPLTSEEAATGRQPLLYIRSADLQQQVWDLRIEQERTVLLINSRVHDRTLLARSKEFIALVYPAIIRQILTTILTAERSAISDDAADWRNQWLRFGASLPGMSELTRLEPPDESAEDDWIADVIKAFCSQQNAMDRLVPPISGE